MALFTSAVVQMKGKGKSDEGVTRQFTSIDSFEGIYSFLDLDFECTVVEWGSANESSPVAYPSARHALYATQYPHRAQDIPEMSTEDLIKLTETEDVCPEWAKIRLLSMNKVQRDKFRRYPKLLQKLVETGDRDLVYENEKDSFFGRVDGRGQNHLGRILSSIRESVKRGTEMEEWLHQCVGILDPKDMRGVSLPNIVIEEIKDDQLTETKHLKDAPYFTFGKLQDNSVVAAHPSISRKHAMIVHSLRGVGIMDLSSTIGTEVNGVKLNPCEFQIIRTQDIVRLGASTRHYRITVDTGHHLRMMERQHAELVREIETEMGNITEEKIKDEAEQIIAQENTVYMGGLDFNTRVPDIKIFFAANDGPVPANIKFPNTGGGKDPGNAAVEVASRGFVFVTFSTPQDTRIALSMDNTDMNGRKVKIKLATKPPGKGKGGKENREKGDGKGKDGKGLEEKRRREDAMFKNSTGDSKPIQDSRALIREEMRKANAKNRAMSRERQRSNERDREHRNRDRDDSNHRHSRHHSRRDDDHHDDERHHPPVHSKPAESHRDHRSRSRRRRRDDHHSDDDEHHGEEEKPKERVQIGRRKEEKKRTWKEDNDHEEDDDYHKKKKKKEKRKFKDHSDDDGEHHREKKRKFKDHSDEDDRKKKKKKHDYKDSDDDEDRKPRRRFKDVDREEI